MAKQSRYLLASADVAATDVAALAGLEGTLVDLGAHGEAPHVDLHAVPVGGHLDRRRLLAAFHRLRQHAALGVGTVDEDVDLVVGMRAHALGVGAEVHLHLLRGVELGDVEVHSRQAPQGDLETRVVDVEGAGAGGRHLVEVDLHEDVALRQAALHGDLVHAHQGGLVESGRELRQGREAFAQHQLALGTCVVTVAGVGSHHRDAFPERSDHGADLAHETIENTTINSCHNFNVFKG